MTNYKKAAVFAKPQGEIGGYLRALLSLLTDAGIEPYLDRMAAGYFPEGAPFPVLSDAALGETCDIALVIGGDGRMLGAARALWPHNLPIIGVHHRRHRRRHGSPDSAHARRARREGRTALFIRAHLP